MKMMKRTVAAKNILVTFLITLFIMGMLISAFAAPTIVLTPTKGPPNTQMRVQGSGFVALATVEIWFDRPPLNGLVDRATDTQLGADVTCDGGGFDVTRDIPVGAAAGDTAIMVIADGGSGAPLVSALFTVTTASIILTPSTGSPGTSVTVTGSGFTPSRRYQIRFDPTGVNVLVVDFTALSDGSVPLSAFLAPDVTAGVKDVLVEEFITGNDIFKTTFTVTTSMTLTQYTGPAGLTITVTCRGLPVVSTGFYDIYFDRDGDGLVDTTPPINDVLLADDVGHTWGKFDKSVTLPSDAAVGTYAIMVISGDATGANLAPIISRTYTVIPYTVTLPVIAQGPVGATFRVTGAGFTPTVAYDVWFDMNFNNLVDLTDVKLADVTAGGGGTFTTDPTVPTAATAGVHRVMVVPDGVSLPILATADFLVTVPAITLSPLSGPCGFTVTVTGTGFTPHTTTFPIEVQISVDKDRDGIHFEAGETMTTVPTPVRPDATGAFTCTFAFPDVTTGYIYDVRAREKVNTNALADATFTVPSPKITLTPNYGVPGETITVTGSQFKISDTVTIWMDLDMDGTYFEGGEQLTTVPTPVTTDPAGYFTCTFTIPPGTLGLYMIAARDTALNYDDASLSVCTPETMAIVAAIADVKTEVDMIEHKLDIGGDFYMFAHGWFTLISDKLGTFTGTDTVASLLYSTKLKTDTIAWTDITAIKTAVQTDIPAMLTAIKAKTDTIAWADITAIKGVVDAIKLKTDTIVWADVTAILTKVTAIEGYVDTEIAAIKAKTDTIVWTDITAIKTEVVAIEAKLDSTTYGLSAIKAAVDLVPKKDWWDLVHLINFRNMVQFKAGTYSTTIPTSAAPVNLGKSSKVTLTVKVTDDYSAGFEIKVYIYDGTAWRTLWFRNIPGAATADCAGTVEFTTGADGRFYLEVSGASFTAFVYSAESAP